MESEKLMARTFIEKELNRLEINPSEQMPLGTWLTFLFPENRVDFMLRKIGPLVRDLMQENNDDANLKLSYHIPYWVQHLLKKPHAPLRFDAYRENQVLEKVDPHNIMPFTGIPPIDLGMNLASDIFIWRWLVQNMGVILEQFEEHKNDILQTDTWKILVISNHATWANLPLLAFCFHYVYGIPKENLYTMVWPAIFTNEFTYQVARHFSNLIKTWPQSRNAQTGYPNAKKVSMQAVRKIIGIASSARLDLPRVIFMAPSGTSDVMKGNSIDMNPPNEVTKWFISTIAKRASIVPIGMNDTSIMVNNSLKRWKAYMRIGNATRSTDDALKELPSLVRDESGRIMGRWSK